MSDSGFFLTTTLRAPLAGEHWPVQTPLLGVCTPLGEAGWPCEPLGAITGGCRCFAVAARLCLGSRQGAPERSWGLSSGLTLAPRPGTLRVLCAAACCVPRAGGEGGVQAVHLV